MSTIEQYRRAKELIRSHVEAVASVPEGEAHDALTRKLIEELSKEGFLSVEDVQTWPLKQQATAQLSEFFPATIRIVLSPYHIARDFLPLRRGEKIPDTLYICHMTTPAIHLRPKGMVSKLNLDYCKANSIRVFHTVPDVYDPSERELIFLWHGGAVYLSYVGKRDIFPSEICKKVMSNLLDASGVSYTEEKNDFLIDGKKIFGWAQHSEDDLVWASGIISLAMTVQTRNLFAGAFYDAVDIEKRVTRVGSLGITYKVFLQKLQETFTRISNSELELDAFNPDEQSVIDTIIIPRYIV